MMKKKNNKKQIKLNPKISPYNIDVTKTYIIPMRSNEDRGTKVEAVPTECQIKVVDRAVMVTNPGFTHYIFSDDNFMWYLHTGYIKVKDEED